MIGVYWNCRGLCRAVTVRTILGLVRNHNPDFLFLAETKSSNVASTMHRLGFFHFVFHPPVGSRGGLLCAWRLGLDVEVVRINANAISLLVYSTPSNNPWLLSGVYGPTDWHKKGSFGILLVIWPRHLMGLGYALETLIAL